MSRLSTENLGELHMAIATFLLKPTDISLRVFSLVELYTAIYLRRDLFDTEAAGLARLGVSADQFETAVRQWFQRPTTRLAGDSVTVYYDISIARAIAPYGSQSPQIISQYLCDRLRDQPWSSDRRPHPADTVELQVELRTTDQGYLRWALGPAAIGVWLDRAARSVLAWPLPRVVAPVAASPLLWRGLHAYARCSDWLTVAPSLGILDSEAFDPLDQAIVLKLMDTIDKFAQWSDPTPLDHYLLVITTAVQAFEAIDQQGRGICNPATSPIRLGLIMLIRNLLYQVMHHGLGLKVAKKI
jgi:hypothetical protein